MKEFEIRYLQKRDLKDIEPFLRSMWLNHAKSNYINRNVLSDLEIDQYFKKAIDQKGEFAFVAEKNGEPIGIIKVEEIRLEKFFKKRSAYYLDDLAVRKEYRNQGVASLLIKKVIKIAKQNNISVLKTRIYAFNKPAQKLFKKHDIQPLYCEYFKKLS